MSFQKLRRAACGLICAALQHAAVQPVMSSATIEPPAADSVLQFVDIRVASAGLVPVFSKYEVTFRVLGTAANKPLWPYDSKPPPGISAGEGISVRAELTDPAGRQFVQPAFYAEDFVDDVRQDHDWHLATGSYRWHVRFSPPTSGTWTYRLIATDRNGTAVSSVLSFEAIVSDSPGFIRVSGEDARYFEFANGRLFTGLGFELPEMFDRATTEAAPTYRQLRSAGVTFGRLTLAPVFGSAWTPWIGGRNQYRSHLPISGLVPYEDGRRGTTSLTMKLDYEPDGDTGWFDACRFRIADRDTAVQPNALYRIRIRYRASDLTGPRDPALPTYGLVGKLGGWHADCHQPGSGTAITPHGGNTDDWRDLEGLWFSGSAAFLPRLHLGLDNVASGSAYIESVSVQEVLGRGEFGPNLLSRGSLAFDSRVDEQKAHAFDLILKEAERQGVYLKVVLGEKEDEIFRMLDDDGGWAKGQDNEDGHYGLGRAVNRTRWLQQAWWRYAQARWGYSTNIHSWELLNEGDPDSVAHYEMADEFGKFMGCRVFEVAIPSTDGARCTFEHPNAHLVTTSFWHSFPADRFWAHPDYPNLDYADIHAYVSTSPAPMSIKELMQYDAAEFHIWHSNYVSRFAINKPVVRGEAGLDSPAAQDVDAAGLARDVSGLWLHNFLWSTLDSGGLHELYWWRSHIWNDRHDFRSTYAAVASFLAHLPLNQGGYEDWNGRITRETMRVVGQKNRAAGRMHLWIQNRASTWTGVPAGQPPEPIQGEIIVDGFDANRTYRVAWVDTRSTSFRVMSDSWITTDHKGVLRIEVNGLVTDVAVLVSAAPRQTADRQPIRRKEVPRD